MCDPSLTGTELVEGVHHEERLTIHHDADGWTAPHGYGTLLAVRNVMGVTGLVRGLDRLLFGA